MAARCWGQERLAGGDEGQYVYAHTSPVYLHVEGRDLRPDPETVAPLVAVLERTLDWVRGEARCATEHQREHLAATLGAAREELLRRQGG